MRAARCSATARSATVRSDGARSRVRSRRILREARYETDCFRAGCGRSARRRGRLHGPGACAERRRGGADLRHHNSPRIPRLEIDLRGARRGQPNDLRAILGNDVACKAARDGTLPYRDGSIVARVAWSYDPLEESSKAFGRAQSFVAGAPKNGVQFMVKDSSKYASTGGWGFAQFDDGKPAGEAAHKPAF